MITKQQHKKIIKRTLYEQSKRKFLLRLLPHQKEMELFIQEILIVNNTEIYYDTNILFYVDNILFDQRYMYEGKYI